MSELLDALSGAKRILNNLKSTQNKKWLKEVGESEFSDIKCEYCNNNFGLTNDFMGSVRDVKFMYTCPYCCHKSILKELQ